MNFRDTMNIAERQLRVLTGALRAIANRTDCDYAGGLESERPTPCPCPRCEARAALETEALWRFEGRGAWRTETMPRERKIVAAWRDYCSVGGDVAKADFRLAQILGEVDRDHGFEMPTARDWYVATSVIQWMATNVGQSLLEAAGYRYGQYEEDRIEREESGYRKALSEIRAVLELARDANDEKVRAFARNLLSEARETCHRHGAVL